VDIEGQLVSSQPSQISAGHSLNDETTETLASNLIEMNESRQLDSIFGVSLRLASYDGDAEGCTGQRSAAFLVQVRPFAYQY
jgi:hypothetical protein